MFSGCFLCGAAPDYAEVYVFGTGGPSGWWDRGDLPSGPFAIYATCNRHWLAEATPVRVERALRALAPGLLESDSCDAPLRPNTLKTPWGGVVYAFLPEPAAAPPETIPPDAFTAPATQYLPPGSEAASLARHRFPAPQGEEATCLVCNGPAAFREFFAFTPNAKWVEGVGFEGPHCYCHTCLGCGVSDAESVGGRIYHICSRMLADALEEAGVPTVTVSELMQARHDNPFGALGCDGASSREPSGPGYVAKLIARALARRQGGK
jgi:hypothetical protein